MEVTNDVTNDLEVSLCLLKGFALLSYNLTVWEYGIG